MVTSYMAEKLHEFITSMEVKETFYVNIENARVYDDGEGS